MESLFNLVVQLVLSLRENCNTALVLPALRGFRRRGKELATAGKHQRHKAQCFLPPKGRLLEETVCTLRLCMSTRGLKHQMAPTLSLIKGLSRDRAAELLEGRKQ